MKIYKYELKIPGVNTVPLPIESEILSVQMQQEKLCMWVMLEPDAPKQIELFVVYGTGWDISDSPGKHLGTVQDRGLVWHVFQANREDYDR